MHPGRESRLKRFGPGSSSEEFEAHLFACMNPKGVHFERCRHVYCCGKWFLAARDTVTLQVFGTYRAQSRPPPAEIVKATSNISRLDPFPRRWINLLRRPARRPSARLARR